MTHLMRLMWLDGGFDPTSRGTVAGLCRCDMDPPEFISAARVIVQVYPLGIRTSCSYALVAWIPPEFISVARVPA
jgi:hypothetical protein